MTYREMLEALDRGEATLTTITESLANDPSDAKAHIHVERFGALRDRFGQKTGCALQVTGRHGELAQAVAYLAMLEGAFTALVNHERDKIRERYGPEFEAELAALREITKRAGK